MMAYIAQHKSKEGVAWARMLGSVAGKMMPKPDWLSADDRPIVERMPVFSIKMIDKIQVDQQTRPARHESNHQ
jgi:hypothetical protein